MLDAMRLSGNATVLYFLSWVVLGSLMLLNLLLVIVLGSFVKESQDMQGDADRELDEMLEANTEYVEQLAVVEHHRAALAKAEETRLLKVRGPT